MSSFTSPIPTEWAADPEKAAFMRDLVLLLNDLVSPEGVIATSTATTEVVLTQQEKLDLMTVTQAVDLDTIEADTAANKTAIDLIATGSPDYTISNDGTVRTLNADAALIVAGLTYSQTDMQTVIDAFGVLSDFTATMNRDLQNKDILG